MGRLAEVDHRCLGRGVDREPSLAFFAGDRGGVDDQRLAVLGAGLAQQRQSLAGAEDQRPQVDRELHVEVLGLDLLHRCPDPDAGVVDQHVEAAVGGLVGLEDGDDVLLLAHVGGDALDLQVVGAQAGDRLLELLRPSRRDGQGVALFAQHPGDRQSDPARSPRDQCCSLCHRLLLRSRTLAAGTLYPVRGRRSVVLRRGAAQ